MRAEDRVGLLDRQRQVVGEVLGALLDRAPEVLERPFQDDWAAAGDDAARMRVAVDQVASLTDASIMTWHRALA
jgi:dGTPase